MPNQFSELFDKLTLRYFDPICRQEGLVLSKACEGVYEIIGPELTMRIRKGTGHFPSFLVTLEENIEGKNPSEPGGEIGLRLIAELNEVTFPKHEANLNDIGSLFKETASIAGTLGFAYLLGTKTAFMKVREYADEKKRSRTQKTYKFPPQVREEWL